MRRSEFKVPARAWAIAILAVASAGCGDHFSTQDATLSCQQERATKNTLTDASFEECVACYEDCGGDCQALGTSPEQYACPP